MNELIQQLREFVAAESVSVNPAGQAAARQWLVKRLAALGAQVEIIATGGAPAVMGKLAGERDDGLLFYGHYDVQDPGPTAAWASAPFALAQRNSRLYGRGAGDNKGQLVATLAGIAAATANRRPPRTLYFLFEGEEEVGSPHLQATVAALAPRLQAVSQVLVVDGSMLPGGTHVLRLGNRGIVSLRLTITTAAHANHSGNAGNVIVNPALTFQAILNRLYDAESGRVLIPGFYAGVTTPTATEVAELDALPYDPAALAQVFGASVTAENKRDYYTRLMFEPTFNVAGVSAGDTGGQTIIPGQLVASLNMRLVGTQSPAAILAGIEQVLAPWLAAGMVTLESTGDTPPSHTTLTPVALAQLQGVAAAAGVPLLVEPVMPGTVPNHVWAPLHAQVLTLPLANFDQQNHAANENISLAALSSGQRLIEALVRGLQAPDSLVQ